MLLIAALLPHSNILYYVVLHAYPNIDRSTIFSLNRDNSSNFKKSNRNRNPKLDISTAPTKAKSWEPAYSQALIQNKIDRQRIRTRESGRQTDGYGVWCSMMTE